jgi:hypothetical protein
MKLWRWVNSFEIFFAITIVVLLIPAVVCAKPPKVPTKKKIVAKKFQQHDFTGQMVQGSLRAPEVFYIFQRKRSEGHQVVRTPSSLDHHRRPTLQTLQGEFKP